MPKRRVQDKKAVLDILHRNAERILSYGVSYVGLFGSFVRDKNITNKSDVDLIVEFHFDKLTFDGFYDLQFFLEDQFGRPVQMLSREYLSPFIGPYI